MKGYEALLEKAARYIQSSRLLEEANDFDSAASRLYYAMFYIAEALLETRGYSYSSHRAVISAFGQHFSKTKVLDPRFHQVLLTAFNQRQLGDYTVDSGLKQRDIDSLLSEAMDFLKVAKDFIAHSD